MRILYIPTFNKITDIDIFFKNKKELKTKNPEIIIVSGGDGSLLHAMQNYWSYNVPFLGIAAGTKNFLMSDFSLEEIIEIAKMSKKEFTKKYSLITTRSMKVLVNRVKSNGEKNIIFSSVAFNDIILGGSVMDFNKFSIRNGIIKGMGILISTPLGSTAFNANNNGEIIRNLSSKKKIFSTLVSENNFKQIIKKIPKIKILSERNNVSLYVDGTTKIFTLKYRDIVSVKPHTKHILVRKK